MTLIELPDEQAAALKARAAGEGLTLEERLARLASVETNGGIPAGESIVHLQRTDPKEWYRRFREWADSHDPNTPVLSDEAMSRESIYRGTGVTFGLVG